MEKPIEFLSPVLNAKGDVVDYLTCAADLLTVTVASVRLDFIRIPAGRFLMGSPQGETGARDNERPVHDVTVSEFFLGRIPITQQQWTAITHLEPRCDKRNRAAELPVVNVWLDEALAFCSKLSHLTGFNVRLPSEAEWEYACRAGNATPFNLGPILSEVSASYASGERTSRLVAQGFFDAPNLFGLHDMHGNVWEWCADIWHEGYEGAPTDGTSWTEGGDTSYCVQRGGSWLSPMSSARSAARVGDIAKNNEDIVGLRVCFSMT